ncbi:hypothetical protein D0Z03_001583 [Geotrichum reessii]|nr:hypothetical protein D0Z03_001583 [Galactomyces reessii]
MSNTNYDDKKQQPLSVTDKSVRESTDSNIRYAGYASRFKAHLHQHGLAGHYKPWDEFEYPSAAVQAKASLENPDWKLVAFKRAIFQSIASMGLPAFTIHSTVKYAGRAMKNVKNPALRTWGPVGLGLAVVPALPYLFDEPVEEAVDFVFDKGQELLK